MIQPRTTSKSPIPLNEADGIIALTPAFQVMSANYIIRWMIGSEPKPGKPFPLHKLFQEPELTRVRAAIKYTMESGQHGAGYDAEMSCDAGIKLRCNYMIHPLFGPGQTIMGALVTFQKTHADKITEPGGNASQANPANHAFPEHYNLIERLPEGVFTITKHWRISSFNHMAEKITGYKREEAIGKYCWEVFRSDKCRQSCPLRTALESGQSIMDQEVRILKKRGGRQPILVNTNVFRNRSGLVIGAVETFRPLTGEIVSPDGIEYHHSFSNIVGKSEGMQRLFSIIPDVAASDANVLIYGESGTGKDLVARAIHQHSLRSKGPFVAVNCAAFAETLLESELFGHEKAAFTGADRAKSGRFELAKGGTLFLDEIGELKPELQVKLLRVLEQREFERVGGTRSIPMDARIISATNRNLSEAIQNGTFREDFFYRLRTVPITLPPLRERKEDIPLLVNYFIKRFNKKYNKSVRSVDIKVMRFLSSCDFPGNVRELERVIEHAFVFVKGPVIFMSSLPEREEFQENIPSFENNMPHHITPKSRDAILWALSKCGGKRKEAAELLNISRTSLWRLIKKYDLG